MKGGHYYYISVDIKPPEHTGGGGGLYKSFSCTEISNKRAGFEHNFLFWKAISSTTVIINLNSNYVYNGDKVINSSFWLLEILYIRQESIDR